MGAAAEPPDLGRETVSPGLRVSPIVLALSAALALTHTIILAFSPGLTPFEWALQAGLVGILIAAAWSTREGLGRPEAWALSLGVWLGLYLTAAVYVSGGDQSPHLVWLLALPAIYFLAAPDIPRAVGACALAAAVGVVILVVLDEARSLTSVLHVIEVAGLGYLAHYAASRQRRLLESKRVAQLAAETALKDLKASERERSETTRMATIGRLAAGVGHEINNPLTYVVHSLDLMREQLAFDEAVDRSEFEQLVARAREGTKRISRIVRDLRVFAGPDREDLAPVDVLKVVDGSVRMVRNQIEQVATLQLRLAHDLPSVLGDPGRLGQAVVNLLVNAVQAVQASQRDGHEIGVMVDTEGDHVIIEVSDSGHGMTAEELDRVFDPNFTTKGPGEGTGLGLTITKRIVEGFGGEIRAESELGGGTRFRIKLIAGSGEVPAGNDTRPELIRRTSRSVLIIDDDTSVLAALQAGLERAYQVEAHTCARAALDRLRAGASFDLILCDVMMPEIDGTVFYREVERDFPELAPRIVFVSGGVFSDPIREFITALPNARLDKPCDLSTLRRFVAAQLLRLE